MRRRKKGEGKGRKGEGKGEGKEMDLRNKLVFLIVVAPRDCDFLVKIGVINKDILFSDLFTIRWSIQSDKEETDEKRRKGKEEKRPPFFFE